LPALSNALSLLSSHRRTRGRRKPFGGGPDGVASRRDEVEKVARQGNCRPATVTTDGHNRDVAIRDLDSAIVERRDVSLADQ
jgi:hypothetical protein